MQQFYNAVHLSLAAQVALVVFFGARNEVRRWARDRSLDGGGLGLPGITHLTANLFGLGLLVAIVFVHGWQTALYALVLTLVGGTLLTVVVSLLSRAALGSLEHPMVWRISAYATWPLMLLIAWLVFFAPGRP